MSMQVVTFNSRVALRPTLRIKIKRRIKEVVRLIVTRGAGHSGLSAAPALYRLIDLRVSSSLRGKARC